jgi:hypothetical protein
MKYSPEINFFIMKQQLLSDFLGSLTIVNYIVAFVFIFIALILKWTWKTKDGVKTCPHSPEKFSWSYWWKDNLYPKAVSSISVLLTVFVTLRFCTEITGRVFSYLIAFLIGLSLDFIIDRLKKMAPKLISETIMQTQVTPVQDPNPPKPGDPNP